MRVVLVFILLIGMFVSGYSVVSYGRASAKSVAIVNEVSSLKQGSSDEAIDSSAARITEELNTVSSYFGALLLAGLGLVFLAAIGIAIDIKSVDHSHDNEIEGYKLTRAR